MLMILIFILTSLGVTATIVRSKLFRPVREKVSSIAQKVTVKPIKWGVNKVNTVMNCETCCSFWIGMPVYVAVYLDISRFIVIFGFISLAVNHIVFNLLDPLIKHLNRR